MMDVVQALELFEACAEEMANEAAAARRENGDGAVRRRVGLTARALAKGEVDVMRLARFELRGSCRDVAGREEPLMSLGALIVFRTADRFSRAGMSPQRTLDAVYRGVQRYAETLPNWLQDGVDKTAIHALMADAVQSGVRERRQRPPRGVPTGTVRVAAKRGPMSGAHR
jgi:hypothetical protein